MPGTHVRKKRHFTRTTSGCLTCRSRHLKCDEGYRLLERGGPRGGACLNCTRAHRDCLRRATETLVFKSSVPPEATSDDSDSGELANPIATDNVPSAEPSSPSPSPPPARATPRRLPDILNPSEAAPPPSTAEDDAIQSETLGAARHLLPSPGITHGSINGDGLSDDHTLSQRSSHLLRTSTAECANTLQVRDEWIYPPSAHNISPSPIHQHHAVPSTGSSGYVPDFDILSSSTAPYRSGSPATVRTSSNLSHPETFRCFHHYISHIAPWYDLWDDQKRFARLLPREALSCPPLLAACVAIGAKHLSRVSDFDQGRELQLYNDAIHLVMPALSASSQEVTSPDLPPGELNIYTHGQILTTLLVMAQYEMCSHSYENFKGHLTGVGRYISHHRLKPEFTDGLFGAAFTSYARLDSYASYINLDTTGIDPASWGFPETPGVPTDETWANRLLVLFAEIVNLRSRCTAEGSRPSMDAWLALRQRLQAWHNNAPSSFEPLFDDLKDDVDGPILFVSSAITSALQTYHSCWILLLFLKPISGDALDAFRAIEPETQPHARRILAIGRTNRSDLNIIVNGMQACHIAGRVLKSDGEREAVLEILEDAEKRTAWATKWRRDALRVEWGWK